jgi:hypothetical protein
MQMHTIKHGHTGVNTGNYGYVNSQRYIETRPDSWKGPTVRHTNTGALPCLQRLVTEIQVRSQSSLDGTCGGEKTLGQDFSVYFGLPLSVSL